jgi:hypothetical protein
MSPITQHRCGAAGRLPVRSHWPTGKPRPPGIGDRRAVRCRLRGSQVVVCWRGRSPNARRTCPYGPRGHGVSSSTRRRRRFGDAAGVAAGAQHLECGCEACHRIPAVGCEAAPDVVERLEQLARQTPAGVTPGALEPFRLMSAVHRGQRLPQPSRVIRLLSPVRQVQVDGQLTAFGEVSGIHAHRYCISGKRAVPVQVPPHNQVVMDVTGRPVSASGFADRRMRSCLPGLP